MANTRYSALRAQTCSGGQSEGSAVYSVRRLSNPHYPRTMRSNIKIMQKNNTPYASRVAGPTRTGYLIEISHHLPGQTFHFQPRDPIIHSIGTESLKSLNFKARPWVLIREAHALVMNFRAVREAVRCASHGCSSSVPAIYILRNEAPHRIIAGSSRRRHALSAGALVAMCARSRDSLNPRFRPNKLNLFFCPLALRAA